MTAFVAACRLLHDCKGRVVVTGMGKSGHIGDKIAATLASTGTPSFFLHPAEASHGDIGMITADDVVIAISNSGETAELITILPVMKRLGVADDRHDRPAAIDARARRRPPCSTSAFPRRHVRTTWRRLRARRRRWRWAMRSRSPCSKRAASREEDFARSHPGGSLGRRLLLHVEDVMRTGEQLPAGLARYARCATACWR